MHFGTERNRAGEGGREGGRDRTFSHHLFPFDTQASLVIGGTVFSAGSIDAIIARWKCGFAWQRAA
jgi:hypothetical protein